MFATITFRIKSPPRKAVLLTTFYCAVAGGLSELMTDTWFSAGTIFVLWQTLVGFAVGMITIKIRE